MLSLVLALAGLCPMTAASAAIVAPLEQPVVTLPAHFKINTSTKHLQEDLLDAREDGERTKLWKRLITRCLSERIAAGLSSSFYDPELSYVPTGYVALRELCFGPIRKDPRGLAYLHRIAAEPVDDSYESLYAALYLADDATPEDVAPILEGYGKFTTEASYRVSFARQLGRAIQAARAPGGDDPSQVVEALAHIEADLGHESLWSRGAALEGWYRAGNGEDAVARVRSILYGDMDPRDRLRVLEPASRILSQPGVDPQLRLDANELAVTSAEDVLANAEVDPTSLEARVSREAKLFQAALGLLEDTADAGHVDFLLRCYADPRSPVLLGISGLQGQRINLQRLRRDLPAQGRARIDEMFFACLIDAGERLFLLQEEPMDREQRSEFEANRDFRYNAASYIAGQWAAQADLREAWMQESDAVEFLAMICQSAADEIEGDDPEHQLYYGVREKLETRVLTGQILAMMQEELDYQIVDPDLGVFFVHTAAAECQAPAAEVLEAFEAFRAASSAHLIVEIPIVREPDDAWIKDEALIGLVELGYVVLVDTDSIRIRMDLPGGA